MCRVLFVLLSHYSVGGLKAISSLTMHDYRHDITSAVFKKVLNLFLLLGFIGKITLQIPFYRPHSDPWVISMSQLNLIVGPAQLQEYDGERDKDEERERKKRLLKALEDKFKVDQECFVFSQKWLLENNNVTIHSSCNVIV